MGELKFRLVYLCGTSGAVTVEDCSPGEIECPRCKSKIMFDYENKKLTDLGEVKHQLRRIVELGNNGEKKEAGDASS